MQFLQIFNYIVSGDKNIKSVTYTVTCCSTKYECPFELFNINSCLGYFSIVNDLNFATYMIKTV